MAKIINFNAKNIVKNSTIAAATAAMCLNLGMSAKDIEAAKAAMHDIAQDEGVGAAKAVIISMDNPNPFDGFYA